MNIVLGYRQDTDKRGRPVITYSNCFHKALLDMGHNVLPMGEGHACKTFESMAPSVLREQHFFLDIDSGRNEKGNLSFHCVDTRAPIPSAVRFIDSHGHPSFHKRAAVYYDHVFFAVWDKRDLFLKHPSAHWCPNASDVTYFDRDIQNKEQPRTVDIGFFGSKGGLDRADELIDICKRHTWAYDVQEIGKNGNRWPKTAEAMANCKLLFNRGQKHDGPNQRVIESMLMDRPLITDRDSRDGMYKLFEEGEHYLGYESASELAQQLSWCFSEPSLAASMGHRAYAEALDKHQVKHRVAQILEVFNASST